MDEMIPALKNLSICMFTKVAIVLWSQNHTPLLYRIFLLILSTIKVKNCYRSS